MYTLFPICSAIVIAQAGPYRSGKKQQLCSDVDAAYNVLHSSILKVNSFWCTFGEQSGTFCRNWGNFAVIID